MPRDSGGHGAEFTLQAQDISRRYPGVHALDNVNLALRAGHVHALAGLNGAGKSTLVKILSGVERPDSGSLLLHGEPVTFRNPRDAVSAGIVTIHQELSVLPNLSVAENVMLAQIASAGIKPLSWTRIRAGARDVLTRLGSSIDISVRAGELTVAQQQVVELAKAIQRDAQVILLDEPTATLPQRDVDILFSVMRRLRSHGVAMIYISHRMEEVYEIADDVTILRDGRVSGTYQVRDLGPGAIAREMVGTASTSRAFAALTSEGQPAKDADPTGEVVLQADDLSDGRRIEHISLAMHEGEMLAIAGLVGSGQSELSKCLFGARAVTRGSISVRGTDVGRLTPRRAIRFGIGLLPADRKYEGLVLGMSVRDNTTLANHARFSRFGVLRGREEAAAAKTIMSELRLKAYGISQLARTLSGGNQQKLVIAKWLIARSRVLIFEEPTRGIDVNAKTEIYALIRDFVARGGSALILSSELSEVMMCDRALVMAQGRIVGEFSHEEMASHRDALLSLFA